MLPVWAEHETVPTVPKPELTIRAEKREVT
jgi:hypothetical protein